MEDGGDQDTPLICCDGEDTTEHYSEENVDISEERSNSDISVHSLFEEVKGSSSASFDSPLQKGEMEEPEVMKHQMFEKLKDQKDKEQEINNKKYLLLNLVCGSLVNKSKSPGQEEWDSEGSVWTNITNLSKDISEQDPQFLLKVAVYTRQELNIRITANFLLALAANLSSTKSHVRRYFCAAVQLPSDWLEVVRIYSTCFSRSLPMCLKKGLTDKFKQFSEYQLAKYNTRKHRCKHSRKKPKRKSPSEQQLKKWADLVRSKPDTIRKLCTGDGEKKVVDKKQSEFSLKKIVKQLHIKEPAEHVMAILGRKYPSDAKAFTHSGIKGTWDRNRAGTRMKLKEPQTWERLLSLEGNKAKTWEKLIDNNSLPFMAMLRNLRNMIVSGISDAHHQKILNKLTNKRAVIQSRQFPIRFLAAYKVIMKLRTSLEEKTAPTLKDILKEILKKIPKSHRFKCQDWNKTPRRRLRSTLSVPLVYRLYMSRRAQLQTDRKQSYSVELLQRYRDALETAVQISCRYNIPPLPGKTVVFLSATMHDFKPPQDFYLPPRTDTPEPEGGSEGKPGYRKGRRRFHPVPEDPLAPTLSELGALLSLMIGSSAEDFSLVLTTWTRWELVELKSDVLLQNVRTVAKRLKEIDEMTDEERHEDKKRPDILGFSMRDKVDNIIVVTENWSDGGIDWAIKNYRDDINNKALCVKVRLNNSADEFTTDSNYMTFSGFSDQMLRFLAERGSSRLLDHVEHLDKVYNIPPPEGAKEPQSNSTVASIPASPHMRWKTVRVFISSTFRDMHTERDALVRSVFPELRRRAAPHCVHVQEVDLRWGVTEEEQARMAQLCLREVCRCQMMVVLLGERYGLVPPKPSLPELPQYSWLSSAPEGLSITEMEIRQFEALCPDPPNRLLCYFRDPSVSKSVPDFTAESKQAESKMAALKSRLWESDAHVHDNYWIELGGVIDEKPNLELFCETVLGDLWTTVKGEFESADESSGDAALSEQEVHQEGLCRQFFGRSKLLSTAVSVVEQTQARGGVLVLEAGPGQGKTVFMAALGQALKPTQMKPTGQGTSFSTAAAGQSSRPEQKTTRDVVSYSTAASQSARSTENLLLFLVKSLRRMRESEDTALPKSYQELLSEFHTVLSELKNRSLVILVDGVDLLLDGSGLMVSDWIPQRVLQGVCLVVSVPTSSPLIQTLSKKKSTALFTLAQLSLSDRREIVQERLDSFGKKLSDSAFNNQVQTLIMKKGAVSPLYLHLACEDLRNFASFEKLKDSLQTLPQSVPQLVQFSLDRLCSENREIPGLHWALAALTVSSTGLNERELYAILNTCKDLYSPEGALTWNKALECSRKPSGRVQMANFTRIVHSLLSLIGSSNCADTNDLLLLSNPEVRRAFEEFFLPTERDRSRAHLLLAAHLWTSANPEGTNTFLHSEASSVRQLPHSLMESNQLDVLAALLSSYDFIFANVRHGLLHHLLEILNSFRSLNRRVDDCLSFLKRHSSLLSLWPSLFVQQALNEPPQTAAHTWAQSMMGKGGPRVVRWLNNSQDTSALVCSFPSEPSCLALSPDGRTAAVGTGRGTLRFVHAETGQVVRSLVSSCDGISSCVFVRDGSLATTSFDGKIEMWDVDNGCRTALVNGHNSAITGSDLSADRKHLATVSLDFMLKVWGSSKGKQVASLLSPCPMNCVTFDPEGHSLAVGCWNGKVTVWNWLQNKTTASLVGHTRSVHSVAFSSSSLLCSGSVSGEVRVWSVPSSSCVGRFQAHSGATEALTFIDDGNKLLSAGADNTLQLWSGGLGRSVTTLQRAKNLDEPPQKRRRVPSVDPVLSVAVTGETAAVATRDALHLYSLDSESKGEILWFEAVSSPVRCLLWVSLENMDSDSDKSQSGSEVLVLGQQSGELQVWVKADAGFTGGLSLASASHFHRDAVLALAENHTYVASASEDCTVALWSRSEIINSNSGPHTVLRGHSGAVTCLCFSPEGNKLLSGGKDQALMIWESRSGSTPVLSRTLHHCHRDWITGCTWTKDCIVSSSNDGRLCFWDVGSGKRVKEICWKSSLTSVCSQGPYVLAGGSDGGLHLWNFDSGAEICHISAHHQPINHCALVTDDKESNPEELTVATASEDGTAKIWKPLQVEHCGSFLGHTGPIRAAIPKTEGPELLTVSEDGSLRCWDWTSESPSRKGSVTALCFGEDNLTVIAGFESGSLEFWNNNRVVGQKQVSGSAVTALCSMPDSQLAVGFSEPHVDVFRVVTTQHGNVSLLSVCSYKVEEPVKSLLYCSELLGVTINNNIIGGPVQDKKDHQWRHSLSAWHLCIRFLGWVRKNDKSVRLAGERDGKVCIALMKIRGRKKPLQFYEDQQHELYPTFGNVRQESLDEEEDEDDDEEEKEEEKKDLITAVLMDDDFVTCGDVKGRMWFNLPPNLSSWSSRKPAHTDRITALRRATNTIVSASRDKTVKIWDGATKKQLGMFVCRAPVLLLEVFPEDETKLVCGDQLGNLYFLCWTQK